MQNKQALVFLSKSAIHNFEDKILFKSKYDKIKRLSESQFQIFLEFAKQKGIPISRLQKKKLVFPPLFEILLTEFPEHNWKPWKFSKGPIGFWNNKTNQRRFFNKLASFFNIKEYDDWYHVSKAQFRSSGTHNILRLYNGSHIKAIMSIFPEYKWDKSKFSHNGGYWIESAIGENGETVGMKHQRQFFNKVAEKMDIKEYKDWYKVKARDLFKHGGKRIVNIYGGSLYQALSSVFPEHNWIPWKFENVPKNLWINEKNVKEFLEEIKKELKIETDNDWNTISQARLSTARAFKVAQKFGGIQKMLASVYPEKCWNTNLLRKKHQINLFKLVESMSSVLK